MTIQSKTSTGGAIAHAVAEGLSGTQKMLPSWLFYDETGDRLFQEIMRMPEYYPTRCEYDILQQSKETLAKHFLYKTRSFQLIELGAGDGLKTEVLLKHLIAKNVGFVYVPIDVSKNALDQLSERLRSSTPELPVKPVNKSYYDALKDLRDQKEKKVVLFMGASIGNFTIQEASDFLGRLVISLTGKDLLLIGFDLKKDPRIIHEAYDDQRGLTRQFNLNMLARVNRELDADFNLENFSHYPYYDPETGAMKSFLISLKAQSVKLAALERTVQFDAWETIQTEVSQKYDLFMIEKLMALSGLKIIEIFYDSEKYFCDVLARPV